MNTRNSRELQKLKEKHPDAFEWIKKAEMRSRLNKQCKADTLDVFSETWSNTDVYIPTPKSRNIIGWQVVFDQIGSTHLQLVTQKFKELLQEWSYKQAIMFLQLFCEHGTCTVEQKIDIIQKAESELKQKVWHEWGYTKTEREIFQVYFLKHAVNWQDVANKKNQDTILQSYQCVMNHEFMHDFTPKDILLRSCITYWATLKDWEVKSKNTLRINNLDTAIENFNSLFWTTYNKNNCFYRTNSPEFYMDFLSIYNHTY